MAKQTEAQSIFYDLANWEFDKVEKQIDNLQTHPDNLIFDKTCYVQSGQRFTFRIGSSLFTEIAWNLANMRGKCPYTEYDQRYACLKRCLQKLKDKGANLEKRMLNIDYYGNRTECSEDTTALREALTKTYDHCPYDLFEFLLKLGCQINNHEYNWLINYLMNRPNDEYFKIALKYGLSTGGKIWVGHSVPAISVKKRFDALWGKKIEDYQRNPNKDNSNMVSYYRETVKALRMKPFIDTGKADVIWAEIKREEEEKARKERERLEKERLEKERKEKERLEKERLERERKERERLAKIKAEQVRIEAERLAKIRAEEARIQAEKNRIEADRLAKIRAEEARIAEIKRKEEAEKQRILEIQRKKDQDSAYIQTALANSEKCKELIQYLTDDFVDHNIDFINELLKMLNNPDEVDTSKVLENIKYLQANKNTNPELGLDDKSRDEMGGAYFLLATTNSQSMIRYKEQFSSQFNDYLKEYNDALFSMADEHIHLEHKKKLVNSL